MGRRMKKIKNIDKGRESKFLVFPMTGKMKSFMSIRKRERERESHTETPRKPWGKSPLRCVRSPSLLPPFRSRQQRTARQCTSVQPNPPHNSICDRCRRVSRMEESKPFFVLALWESDIGRVCVRRRVSMGGWVLGRERERGGKCVWCVIATVSVYVPLYARHATSYRTHVFCVCFWPIEPPEKLETANSESLCSICGKSTKNRLRQCHKQILE